MTRIEFQGVTKRFGEVVALHPTHLAIEAGEFFTLLGPSGSGKSTLLRILTGLEQPTEGRLLFDGEDVTRMPPWKRGCAMVFQNYALYPHMTVAQNIAYPLKIRKMPAPEQNARVEEVAASLSIGHLLQRKPGQLSGGQQQRVALARALAQKPRVFLFDEPLSNLDARLRLEARVFLKQLQAELKVTSIYVTHDQTEAMALSDRMAILEFGHLRQVGSPGEVYHRPASPFVATFIGHPPANILEAELLPDGMALGKSRVERPDSELEGKVHLAVRPEHIVWDAEGHLDARVVTCEDFGHEMWITVDLDGQHAVLRRFQPLAPGTVGRVRLQIEKLTVFSPPAPA